MEIPPSSKILKRHGLPLWKFSNYSFLSWENQLKKTLGNHINHILTCPLHKLKWKDFNNTCAFILLLLLSNHLFAKIWPTQKIIVTTKLFRDTCVKFCNTFWVIICQPANWKLLHSGNHYDTFDQTIQSSYVWRPNIETSFQFESSGRHEWSALSRLATASCLA